MAPLSLVQAVIAGGLAMLAIPARHWFGIAVSRREMVGLVLCGVGLRLPGADRRTRPHRAASTRSTMLGFEVGMLTLGGMLMLTSSRRTVHGAVLLAVAAGTLLGVSDVALKALAETRSRAAAEPAQPLDPRCHSRRHRRRSSPSLGGSSSASRSP